MNQDNHRKVMEHAQKEWDKVDKDDPQAVLSYRLSMIMIDQFMGVMAKRRDQGEDANVFMQCAAVAIANFIVSTSVTLGGPQNCEANASAIQLMVSQACIDRLGPYLAGNHEGWSTAGNLRPAKH
jgi:hypothetical protein